MVLEVGGFPSLKDPTRYHQLRKPPCVALCERTLRHLTNVFMEDPESDGFAEGYCQTQCATNLCKFYWEGQEKQNEHIKFYKFF